MGQTAAIVGIQDTQGPVTVEYLTVSGASLTPAGLATGQWSGIAYINSSGTVSHNQVKSIEVSAIIGQASVHGMEMKTTAGTHSLEITHNYLAQYAGHVAIDLMAGGLTSGVLTATVTDNIIIGDPADTLTPVAQFGIAAGGLSGLVVRRNNIAHFSSPWNVSGIWLDPLNPEATWTIAYNSLVANDNGISIHGASGGVIAHNSILAGAAGIEMGPQFNVPSGQIPASSSNSLIQGNTIAGSPTVATTQVTINGTTVESAITGQPVDGILVWDGQQNRFIGNHVSGFVNDAYMGEDPVFLNNAVSWSPGTMPSYDNQGNSLSFNAWGPLATPASSSGVTGYAVVNANNATPFVVDASNNWWGSPSGPSNIANTFNPATQGLPVSAGVNYTPWLTFVPALDLTEATGQTPFSSIGAALSEATPGASLSLATGTFVENVTVSISGVTLASQSSLAPATIQASPTMSMPATISIQADDVTIQSVTVEAPSSGYGVWVGSDPASPILGAQLLGCHIIGGAIGILFTAETEGSVIGVTVEQFARYGISLGNETLGGQGSRVAVQNSVVTGANSPSGTLTGVRWTDGAAGILSDSVITTVGTGVVIEDTAAVTLSQNQLQSVQTGIVITATTAGSIMTDLVLTNNLVAPTPSVSGEVVRGIWVYPQVAATTMAVIANENLLQGVLDAFAQGVVIGQTDVAATISWAGSGNTVTGWRTGLMVLGDPAVLTFSYNNIVDNVTAANNGSVSPIVLSNNWWGAPSAPTNVSGNLVVQPVLTAPVASAS